MEFSPVIYEHAASLIGRTPWEVSRDGELLLDAQTEAFKCYKHTPNVIGIDVYNVEAEAYGAEIEQPEGHGIPSIIKHPYSSTTKLARIKHFNPLSAGRVPMIMEIARRFLLRFPGQDVRIPITGPFSLAGNLIGLDTLLCECLTDQNGVRDALDHLVSGQILFCRECVKAGLKLILFESSATPPLISPDIFKRIVLPPLRELIEKAGERTGAPIPCIIGGNTLPILEYISATGTDYIICPVETDQCGFMEKMKSHLRIKVRINMEPAVFVANDESCLYAEADRVMKIAGIRDNVCIGSGAIPYEAKPDMVIAAKEYVSNYKRE